MNRRLQQFLNAENISQSQFADNIGVARASVSHIIAGRNKPGFDFIENMSKRYPSLNLEWLITGKGKMYKIQGEKAPVSEPVEDSVPDLFSATDGIVENPKIAVEEIGEVEASNPRPRQKASPQREINTLNKTNQSSMSQRFITKIMVFYNDGTYQELK